ncbi:MAG TPA: HEAT repeat domain-containing protein, partial [Pirellulaceae bacterium]|nr:HEAT repeat domain-containing protein [Pirellulaceae bacterium]
AKIMAAAEQASSLKTDALDALMTAFTDEDSAVRYWAAMGLLMRGEAGVSLGRDQLRKALGDESPHVRIAAAEALGRYGNKEDITAALSVLLTLASPVDNGIYTSMSALNAIDYLDANAAPIADMVAELPDEDPNANGRMSAYAKNLIDKTLSDLK